jgi:type I restriction enzyme, S subunit
MDAKEFIAEFGHIVNAPNGVAQLREMILSLALQGKLVPQNSMDTNAEHLLIDIQKEMYTLLEQKKIRKKIQIFNRGQHDTNRLLPKQWIWVKNEELFKLIKGKVPKNLTFSKKRISYLDIEALDRGNVTRFTDDESSIQSTDADLLVVCDGSRSGLVLKGKSGAIGSTLSLILTPETVKSYVNLIFKEGYARLNSNMKGAAIPHLNTKKLLNEIVGLPPLEEQSRIVSKVDELTKLCDILEEQQQKKRKLQNQLRIATLKELVAANRPLEIKHHWQRLQENFSQMYSTSGDVEEIKNCVTNLLLRGMFNCTSKNTISFELEEKAYLPKNWNYQKLANLSEYITSGSRGWNKYYSSIGDTFIRSQDIKSNALNYDDRAFVSLPENVEGKRTLVKSGDILITITGGNVGKCATVPILNYDAYVSQHVALVRIKNTLYSKYFHEWIINSYGGQNFLSQFIYGDKPGLNLKQVGSIEVPLPPEDEMIKILTLLEQFNSNFNKLKQELTEKSLLARKLSIASIASLTGINTPQEEESLKTPITELIAPVTLGSNKPGSKDVAPIAKLLARQNGKINANDLWQHFGGEIDAFYAQLKEEITHGWIAEPTKAEMLEKAPE